MTIKSNLCSWLHALLMSLARDPAMAALTLLCILAPILALWGALR